MTTKKQSIKTIGIKLGSALLADKKGNINKKLIKEICRQISLLIKQGKQVFIITSGAIASDPKKYRSKNLRSSVGQPKLMHLYVKYFSLYGIETSQHLLTDRELLAKDSAVTKATLLEALSEKVVPIINANDSVDSFELNKIKLCADNDCLLTLVSNLLFPNLVIIGFGENGLKNNHGEIIHHVKSSEISKVLNYARGGNSMGHGQNGMRTKILMLDKLAKKGILAILAPGKEKDFILRSVAKEKNFGTLFTT